MQDLNNQIFLSAIVVVVVVSGNKNNNNNSWSISVYYVQRTMPGPLYSLSY